MGGQLGELVVSISADIARFREDMGKANRTTQETMNRMAGDVNRGVSAIDRSMSAMAATIAGTFTVGSVIAFTRETAAAALAAEKLNMQFKASTGNAQAAAREMGYVREMSNRLGLDFQSTATAYAKFLASTRGSSLEGEASRRIYEAFSKEVTALGLSADSAGRVFYALNQMMAKGKVGAEEFKQQLGDHLPDALLMASQALGITKNEVLKLMESGELMTYDLLPRMAEQIEKTYGKAAEEASKKGQAGINRFNNEVRETASAIGSVLMPAVNTAADAMTTLLRSARGTGWEFSVKNAASNLGMAFLPADGTFALPKPGEDTSLKSRNERQKALYAAKAAAESNVDPQMARIAADRRAEQERINASRAAAEKHAAGAAEREKAAKAAASERDKAAKKAAQEKVDAQKQYNQLLADQNRLIEQELKGWEDLTLSASVLKGELLTAPTPAKTRFSLSGGDSTLYGGNGQVTPPVDYAAAQRAAQELADINYDTASVRASTPNIFGDTNTSAQMKVEYDRQQTMYDDLMLAQDVYTEEGLAKYHAYADQREAIDKKYIAEKKALENAQWGQSADIISSNMDTIGRILMQGSKEQFEQGKKFAIASALIDTYMAASAAFAGGVKAASGPWGVALGVASAAVAVGAGMAQVAAIDAQRYEGREKGGPVNAGQTYIVGEKRPELFTPTQSGYITPYVPAGGQKVEVTQVFQMSPGLNGAIQAELQRAAPYFMEMSIQGVKAAMRNGEFQGV